MSQSIHRKYNLNLNIYKIHTILNVILSTNWIVSFDFYFNWIVIWYIYMGIFKYKISVKSQKIFYITIVTGNSLSKKVYTPPPNNIAPLWDKKIVTCIRNMTSMNSNKDVYTLKVQKLPYRIDPCWELAKWKQALSIRFESEILFSTRHLSF